MLLYFCVSDLIGTYVYTNVDLFFPMPLSKVGGANIPPNCDYSPHQRYKFILDTESGTG